ncbi:MAG: hypothetical protein GX638_16910 [Crenarchaeota archaeon]|nr:hypothetical protein [Thermoproteota archaeon]
MKWKGKTAMLNKNQYYSLMIVSLLISIALSLGMFFVIYDQNDSIVISVCFSVIPVLIACGIISIYFFSLKDVNFELFKVMSGIAKSFFKILTFGIVAFGIGIGLKIPIQIGHDIYDFYKSNENIQKQIYANNIMSNSNWASSNITIGNVSYFEENYYNNPKPIMKFKAYNKSKVALNKIAIRVTVQNHKNDTLYNNVFGVDCNIYPDNNETLKQYLPKKFFDFIGYNKITITPQSATINQYFSNNVNSKNLSILLSN